MSLQPPASGPRTLADQLRSWSDEQLAGLLRVRPDLAAPAPQDLGQLAARATTKGSVLRAADQLTWCELAVLDALVVCDGAASRQRLGQIVHAEAVAIDAAVLHLSQLVLVWGTEGSLRVPGPVIESIGCPVSKAGPTLTTLLTPLGPARIAEIATNLDLAPTGDPTSDLVLIGEQLSDPAIVRQLLATLPQSSARMLGHLESVGAAGQIGNQQATVGPLLDKGLLALRDAHHVVVPREVLLALRDGHTTRERVDAKPALVTSTREPKLVAHAASGAAAEFTRQCELLLEHWGSHPPVGLRGGGVGVRDLRAAAALLHVPEATAVLVIETCAAAGLLTLGHTDELDAAWLPTAAFDIWVHEPVAQRWVRLARAWLDNPRLTSAVGSKLQGKLVNALSADLERSWLATTRRETLGELAGIPDGEVLAPGTGVPSLAERVAWLRPRRPAARAEAVARILEESAILGMVGLGGMPTYARSLIHAGSSTRPGSEPGPEAGLAALLPPTVEQVLIQADLTAIAPGPLDTEFGRRLALVADIESRGGATVYRFGESSVRRAFDSGWAREEVHEFLREASSTEVPQPLTYLVDDVSRRFGSIRVGAAESFLRSDDELALSELVHDTRAASLRLRRIAPTVVVSDVSVDVLLPRLRELGLAPVVEAADGTVQVARREAYRAPSPVTRPRGLMLARSEVGVTAVVAALRAGEHASTNRPAGVARPTGPASLIAQLNEAVDRAGTLWISYADNDGSIMDRVVDPVRIDGGRLTAYDHRTEQNRSFALHRITGVRPLT